MKKLSLLIALCMLLTVGGVYATWTYTQATDVADEAVNMSLNLGTVAYIGTYGTYSINQDSLKLTIDPKAGTTHTTALTVSGEVVITFTPNTYAPEEVKQDAVASTFAFTLANPSWLYDDDTTDGEAAKPIVVLAHPEAHNITWTKQGDGSFTMTLDAAAIAEHIQLTEFNLDTKSDYDAYNTVLGQGSIVLTVSDGVTSAP